MLARYMDESQSIPTATSLPSITVTALDAAASGSEAASASPSRT